MNMLWWAHLFHCHSSLRLWAVSGEVLMEMVGHTAIVYSVDSHASGLIVSGSEDRYAKIWKGDPLCLMLFVLEIVCQWTCTYRLIDVCTLFFHALVWWAKELILVVYTWHVRSTMKIFIKENCFLVSLVGCDFFTINLCSCKIESYGNICRYCDLLISFKHGENQPDIEDSSSIFWCHVSIFIVWSCYTCKIFKVVAWLISSAQRSQFSIRTNYFGFCA